MHKIEIDAIETDVEFRGATPAEFPSVLTHEALRFVGILEREFRSKRRELLAARIKRQVQIDSGLLPDFLTSTKSIRERVNWTIGSIPDDLQKRTVEITGPVDRKMMINALNSGANVFMADFEDANSPTWENLMQGHINLRDAIDRSISFENPDARKYSLNDEIAVLMVRPRGWHLEEKHLLLDGEPISASLFDFGMYFFHNARTLVEKGSGPYFYLPKLESHLEARLWNSVFDFAQDAMGIPRGTIKVTVLIETILAAFEMEEILFELKDHIVGLNAGRWDYMFSIIKKFRNQPDFLLPDRARLTMTVPFMRAYTELLVQTCHKRGAHAIGGMAAFIPNRKDPAVTEVALQKVREDKLRESADGFDGTWVAHPDLVSIAMEPFAKILGTSPHQKQRMRNDVQVGAADLLNFRVSGGEVTEAGVRSNVNVGILYIESWLRGVGAAAIYNLMEDTATAEISRSQMWQWLHHTGAKLSDGRKLDAPFYRMIVNEEMKKIEELFGTDLFKSGRFDLARKLFDELILEKEFTEFLTLKAYEHIS